MVMVSRRSTQSVTQRSTRQSELHMTRRPRRLLAPKTVDDAVGLSRKEERELKKALYASLQESRRPRTPLPEEESAVRDEETVACDEEETAACDEEETAASDEPATLRKSTRHITPTTAFCAGGQDRSRTPSSVTRGAAGLDETSQDSSQDSSVASSHAAKKKVHAQRKFAQGCSLPTTPNMTPNKQATSPHSLLDRVPKTEDFLTFLCLRGSHLLPANLDFFNFARDESALEEDSGRLRSPAVGGQGGQSESTRESTPESSSSGSNVNEELSEITAPIMTAAARLLQASRGAARASAGTPETARGIVSLRQGLTRKRVAPGPFQPLKPLRPAHPAGRKDKKQPPPPPPSNASPVRKILEGASKKLRKTQSPEEPSRPQQKDVRAAENRSRDDRARNRSTLDSKKKKKKKTTTLQRSRKVEVKRSHRAAPRVPPASTKSQRRSSMRLKSLAKILGRKRPNYSLVLSGYADVEEYEEEQKKKAAKSALLKAKAEARARARSKKAAATTPTTNRPRARVKAPQKMRTRSLSIGAREGEGKSAEKERTDERKAGDRTDERRVGEKIAVHERKAGEKTQERKTGEKVEERTGGDKIPERRAGEKIEERRAGEKTEERKAGEKTEERKAGEKTEEKKAGEKTEEKKAGEKTEERRTSGERAGVVKRSLSTSRRDPKDPKDPKDQSPLASVVEVKRLKREGPAPGGGVTGGGAGEKDGGGGGSSKQSGARESVKKAAPATPPQAKKVTPKKVTPERGSGSSNSSVPASSPPDAGLTGLETVPTFRPTEEEFADPVAYMESLRGRAEGCGMCRVLPPASWRMESKVNEDIRFTTQVQHLHRLYSRWGSSVEQTRAIVHHLRDLAAKQHASCTSQIGGVEVDLPRLYGMIRDLGGLQNIVDKKQWVKVADAMKIPKTAHDRVTRLYDVYCKFVLPYAMLSDAEREQAQRDAHTHYELSSAEEDAVLKGKSMTLGTFSRIAGNLQSMWFREDPSPEMMEAAYWKLVQEGEAHVSVQCAHVNTRAQSTAFPLRRESPYFRHSWNLNNLPDNKNCILKCLGPVPGTTIPTLHVGMLFSTSCWSTDPHRLPYVQYLHSGAPTVWYCIPKSEVDKFHEAMKELCPTLIHNTPLWLSEDTAMVKPDQLTSRGVRVLRCEQQARQFVVVFPDAFTATVSCGYNVSESVHYATTRWLSVGVDAAKALCSSGEKELFSVDTLVCGLCQDSSDLDTLSAALPMLQTIVTRELCERRQLSGAGLKCERRLAVEDSPGTSASLARKRSHDLAQDSACEVCYKICYLSMVLNEHDEQILCLEHGLRHVQRKRHVKAAKLFYRYTEEELTELVQTTRERLASLSAAGAATGPAAKKRVLKKQDSRS